MSKREKNIEIIENEKMINGDVILELSVRHKSVGTVRFSGKEYVAKLPNGEQFRSRNQDDAESFLIRNYHLHHGN